MGSFTPTGALGTGRYSATATLLPTGQVLLAGGYEETGYLASAELYSTSSCPTCTLTVTREGTGSGTVSSAGGEITCPDACTADFETGTSVTLTAAPAAGSSFTGWGGACGEASGDTCTLTMDASKEVTATFTRVTSLLTVLIGGSSAGSVSSSPAGITGCTGSCSASFASGTVVSLTASAGGGGSFREWRGDACAGSTHLTCVAAMTAAKSVTAVFSQTFTDGPLTPLVTPIKAVHVTELRAAIDTLRSHHGLPGFAWTDASLSPRITPVKRTHLLDLRTSLSQAYSRAGRPTPTYAEPTITAGQTMIKASHLTELHSYVRVLE
jgi:hypothetical protein